MDEFARVLLEKTSGYAEAGDADLAKSSAKLLLQFLTDLSDGEARKVAASAATVVSDVAPYVAEAFLAVVKGGAEAGVEALDQCSANLASDLSAYGDHSEVLVIAEGNTPHYRRDLRELGFRWDRSKRHWAQQVPKDEGHGLVEAVAALNLPGDNDIEARSSPVLLSPSRSFSEARAFARALGLSDPEAWAAYVRGRAGNEPKPDDVPAQPDVVYAGHGWSSWSDWLGPEESVAGQPSFAEFRAWARTLRLSGSHAWQGLCRRREFESPFGEDPPVDPSQVYSGKGWIGWNDFLGC